MNGLWKWIGLSMNTENNRFINFMMTDYRNIFLPSFFILFSICLFGQNSVVQTFDTDISKNKIKLYTTAKDTDLRLTRGDDHFFSNLVQPLETEIAIFVNPKKTFQKFLGIGGAITDASSEVFSKISKKNQEKLLKAYYSEDGIAYNIIRTSIHSSDFGLGSHTYIEEGDSELKSFSIEKDLSSESPSSMYV